MKPAYDEFIKPTMKHADIIVPMAYYNECAVDMLTQTLRIKIALMSSEKNQDDPLSPWSKAVHEELHILGIAI